jgi:hypothetical protein
MHPSSIKGVGGGGPTPIQPYASTYGQKYAGVDTVYHQPALLPHLGDLAYQAPSGYHLVPQQAQSSVYVPSTTPSSQYSGPYKGAPYSGQGGGKNPPNESELRKHGFEHARNIKDVKKSKQAHHTKSPESDEMSCRSHRSDHTKDSETYQMAQFSSDPHESRSETESVEDVSTLWNSKKS